MICYNLVNANNPQVDTVTSKPRCLLHLLFGKSNPAVRGGPVCLDRSEKFLSDKPPLFILPSLFLAEYSSKPHRASSRQDLDDAAAYCTDVNQLASSFLAEAIESYALR